MRQFLPWLALLTSCAHHRVPVAQTPPPVPRWLDTAEYEIADLAAKEPDAAKRLALLDKWTRLYPATEFLDNRQDLYLQTYKVLAQMQEEFDVAQGILRAHPTNVQALYSTLQTVMALKPGPAPSDLDVGEKAALALLDNPVVFEGSNKPPATTDADWVRTQTASKLYASKSWSRFTLPVRTTSARSPI